MDVDNNDNNELLINEADPNENKFLDNVSEDEEIVEENKLRDEQTYKFNLTNYKIFKNAHLTTAPTHKLSKDEQILEILKCKYNILYFLRNYCKIPIAGGGNVPLALNKKIETVALLFQASTQHVFQTSRQSSKTTIQLVCYMWLTNFWANTKAILFNLAAAENKKNLVLIKQMIALLPPYMRSYNPKVHPNNVESFKNGIEASIAIKSVDRTDPTATLRGFSGSLYIDECAFIRNVHLAYSPMVFVYSNYAKISRLNLVPAPLSITSTPNSPDTPEGELFKKKWDEALEIDYDEIKDMLPHEIYEYVLENSPSSMAKVYQYWYEFPERCDPELYNPNNENNILDMLQDPFVDLDELKKYSKSAVEYLKLVRSLCTSKMQLRREVYCEFLSSVSQSIFDEDFLESIPRLEPVERFKMPHAIQGEFNIYRKRDPNLIRDTNYALCIDPAYSVSKKGDFAGIVLFNLNNMDIEATARLKTGKTTNLVEVTKFIHSLYPNAIIIIERNNFGIAVIERLLEDPKIIGSLYYSYGKRKLSRMTNEQLIHDKIYGIQTDKDSRPKMIQMMIKYVLENPDKLKSKELINELLYLEEKRNNRVEAANGQHDDLVMALGFILYLLEYNEKSLTRFKRLTTTSIKNIYAISMLNNRDAYSNLNSNPNSTDTIDLEKLTKQGYDIRYNTNNEYYSLNEFKNENTGMDMKWLINLNKM